MSLGDSRISAVLTVNRSLPLYPDNRTCPKSVGMSQRCHEETHAAHLTARSLARPNLALAILLHRFSCSPYLCDRTVVNKLSFQSRRHDPHHDQPLEVGKHAHVVACDN